MILEKDPATVEEGTTWLLENYDCLERESPHEGWIIHDDKGREVGSFKEDDFLRYSKEEIAAKIKEVSAELDKTS